MTVPGADRPRVVVVDDHELFRAGVRGELEVACEVVGEAGDVPDGIAVVLRTAPDVVLLDVHLPGGGAVEVLRGLRDAGGTARVLALSVSDAPEDVVAVIRAGASGYVTKSIRPADLVAAVLRTHDGEPVFGPRLATFVLRAFSEGASPEAPGDLDALTPREREVLHHLARGYAYKQIGLRLDISPRTVESHVSAVLRKLQLTSRHEVSRWAAERGLLE